jgi:serine/threonine protein kinase
MAAQRVFDTAFDVYKVTGPLGQGGAGQVFSVENQAGDSLALKLLGKTGVTSERLKRFQNEIAFCQKDSHPGIIKVLDSGYAIVDSVKCPFYVMPRYPATLRSVVGKVSPQEGLRLFSQLLDAVEAAHLLRVVHRDLKPENVLLSDGNRAIAVCDFGIARFEEDALYVAVETKHNSRMANFQYSAPEQRARGQPVDQRADIFALGLMLNELFTGEILQGTGHRRVGEVQPDIAYLDDIIEGMVQQNPDRRPGSIDALKKELVGRKHVQVERQRLEREKQLVVPASEAPAFEPIRIVDFDVDPARSSLILKLSRNVTPEWVEGYRRQGSGLLGYTGDRWVVRGDSASISAVHDDPKLVQQLIDYAKTYAQAADAFALDVLKRQAKEEDARVRKEREDAVRHAEAKRKIFENVRL